MIRRPHFLLLATLVALVGLGGCASSGPPMDALLPPEHSEAGSAPLGGESLAQRKVELRRAHRDLVHFYATLESLQMRRDRNGLIQFRGFLDAYMGIHLDPLLEADWQSEHPELMGFDANLRLLQAEVLMHMRSPQRMQRAIDEIERRYAGREEMLVDYPIGSKSTLAEALDTLSRRKWRG